MKSLASVLDRVWGRVFILLIAVMLLVGLVVAIRTQAAAGIRDAANNQVGASGVTQVTDKDDALLSTVRGEGYSITVGEYPEIDKAFEELHELERNNDPRAWDKQTEIDEMLRERGLMRAIPQTSK